MENGEWRLVKTKNQLKQCLTDFTRMLQGKFSIFAVVLYGSYAAGNPHQDSDIDIAVFSDDFSGNHYEATKELFKLRRKIDTSIEPLAFSVQEFLHDSDSGFVSHIRKNGQLIFLDNQFLI